MINKLIANLYVPINTILSCNQDWRQSLCLPEVNSQDVKIINQMQKAFLPFIDNNIQQRQIVVDTNFCIRKIKSLSFYKYLLDRLINQATSLANEGIRNFIIQNSNSSYFNNPIVYWMIRVLSSQLKLKCNSQFTIGLRLHFQMNKQALDIACRNNLDYIIINENNEKNIGDLFLQRTLMNNKNVKIYNFNGSSLNQQGFIISTQKTQLKQSLEILKKHLYIRHMVSQYPFFPKKNIYPIIVDSWEQKDVNAFLDQADFVILNACLSRYGYCDCGIDINKLNVVLKKGEIK